MTFFSRLLLLLPSVTFSLPHFFFLIFALTFVSVCECLIQIYSHTYEYQTGVHSAKTHKLVRILYDTRKQFSEKLDKLALPIQRSFEIELTHGRRAAVQMLYPPSWREELRDAAFPVLVEV